MKKISDGIVFSNDIYRILNGYNALDFKYNGMVIPSIDFIEDIRLDFKKNVTDIFSKVTIVNEEDMVNGIYSIVDFNEYPHCIFR